MISNTLPNSHNTVRMPNGPAPLPPVWTRQASTGGTHPLQHARWSTDRGASCDMEFERLFDADDRVPIPPRLSARASFPTSTDVFLAATPLPAPATSTGLAVATPAIGCQPLAATHAAKRRAVDTVDTPPERKRTGRPPLTVDSIARPRPTVLTSRSEVREALRAFPAELFMPRDPVDKDMLQDVLSTDRKKAGRKVHAMDVPRIVQLHCFESMAPRAGEKASRSRELVSAWLTSNDPARPFRSLEDMQLHLLRLTPPRRARLNTLEGVAKANPEWVGLPMFNQRALPTATGGDRASNHSASNVAPQPSTVDPAATRPASPERSPGSSTTA